MILQALPAFWKCTLWDFAFTIDLPVFTNQKKSEEDFSFSKKRWKAKLAFIICFMGIFYWRSGHPEQQKGPHQAPSLEITLCISSLCGFEMFLRASELFLHLSCVFISEMCLKVAEKPEGS